MVSLNINTCSVFNNISGRGRGEEGGKEIDQDFHLL